MKILGVTLLLLLLTGCGTLHQHMGKVPEGINIRDYSEIDLQKDEFSTLICAEGDRRYYFLGTSKPNLSLTFTDEEFKFFNSSYDAVRLNSGKRSFKLKFDYKDQFAVFNVNGFVFEPNTTYYAKYSVNTSKTVKVWIEKSNGEVVYGKKPAEGQL
jgi:hypothetical protein